MTAQPIVLGTAGHIDHGKTSLVRALTGIDTDRLPVEKARGITTELGFARLELGARRIAVVDVPGHERFVKSMVAGATGLDLVCLVIAADEGVMPQTREHLDICDLLGIRHGVIVLTKRDLVDDAWLEMVTADVREAVAGTFLAHAPIVPVSTRSGSGLDDLRATLATVVAALPPRSASGVFRMPIDRVFTVKGFGTIVTGTILGGEVTATSELVVIPSGLPVRVRGIEVHGAPAERAVAGHRAALNLGGIAVDELARGDLLAAPNRVAASHILDVELRYLATASGPLPARSKVLLHHGTAQVLAALHLLDDANAREPSSAAKSREPGSERQAAAWPPGTTGFAQLRLDATTPLGALPGDRFILRGFAKTAQHGSTIAGGRIVRALAPKARRGSDHGHAVAALAAARRDQRIALEVRNAASAGLAAPELVRRLGIPADALATPLATLVAGGELLATGDGEHAHYLHAIVVAELEAKLGALVTAEGTTREALRTQLPAALPARSFDAILAGLERRGTLVTVADRVARPEPRAPTMSPVDVALLAALKAAGVEPPRPKELAGVIGVGEAVAKAALDRVVAARLAVKVKSDLVMHAEVVADVRTRLVAFLDAHKTIDAQQWKELTGASRKFTIPLAEYFDAEKLTLRVGDLRRKR